MRDKKHVSDSQVIKSELIMPNDTNMYNNLMGGRLMHWMDIAAGISAQRFSGKMIVTASVDNINFGAPIPLGSVVTLTARVTESFNTSMEVYIEVWAEHVKTKEKFKSNSAFFTFVAVDESGRPVEVPEAIAVSDSEKLEREDARKRKQLRLWRAGRLSNEEANELKKLFLPHERE